MCGRFTLTAPLDVVEKAFDVRTRGFSWLPRYDVAPTQPVLTVNQSDGERTAALRRWGLIPSWAKDSTISVRMINARAETVAEKPSLRRALLRSRCLVVADGFYEWKRAAGRKLPHRIILTGGEPFAFAGLWEVWTPSSGTPIHSCAIIAASANSFMEAIHDRMPVVLAPAAYDRWLDRNLTDPAKALPLLAEGAVEFSACAVSTLVSNVRHEGPECVAPAC